MGGTTDESEQTVYCYGLWLDSGLNFGCTHPCATCKYHCHGAVPLLGVVLSAQLVEDFNPRWRDADNNEPLCAAAATSQVGRFDVQAIELWALMEI